MDDRLQLFDERICQLGEGPVWHPLRQTLYWVDILGKRLLSKGAAGASEIAFDESVSALGWIDAAHLLVASETGLSAIDLDSGARSPLVSIEGDRRDMRSNDGRADPWGGFWIGTMSKTAKAGAGTLYRWYKDELRPVARGVTVPNGTCFDRGRRRAYFTDSAQRMTYAVMLDADGWPEGEPELFLDNRESGVTIDGAVVDQDGCMWAALWDDGVIRRFSPSAEILDDIIMRTPRPTCPAFGGEQAGDLYVTSAAVGLDRATRDAVPHGATLLFRHIARGVVEPSVIVGAARDQR